MLVAEDTDKAELKAMAARLRSLGREEEAREVDAIVVGMLNQELREQALSDIYFKGDRVELVQTEDLYTNLKPGAKGTVESVDILHIPTPEAPYQKQVWIRWDSGSHLAMVIPPDTIKKVQ